MKKTKHKTKTAKRSAFSLKPSWLTRTTQKHINQIVVRAESLSDDPCFDKDILEAALLGIAFRTENPATTADLFHAILNSKNFEFVNTVEKIYSDFTVCCMA